MEPLGPHTHQFPPATLFYQFVARACTGCPNLLLQLPLLLMPCYCPPILNQPLTSWVWIWDHFPLCLWSFLLIPLFLVLTACFHPLVLTACFHPLFLVLLVSISTALLFLPSLCLPSKKKTPCASRTTPSSQSQPLSHFYPTVLTACLPHSPPLSSCDCASCPRSALVQYTPF